MKPDEMGRLVMELRDEKLQREAVEKYKRECFLFWKDIAFLVCSVVGVVISVTAFVRTL